LIVYELFRNTALLSLAQPDRLEPLLHSEFDERNAQVSPDGKWIAYESDESGQQFARREQISIDGGFFPLWGPRGSDELYYVNPEGEIDGRHGEAIAGSVIGKRIQAF
jgi:WD40-like Beta Propeller Repeat